MQSGLDLAGIQARPQLEHDLEVIHAGLLAGVRPQHELQPLDEAQTRAVLRQRAEARGLVLGDEVLDFLLARFSRDLGSLTQLLEQLDGYALRTRRALTIPLVKAMLQEE